MSNRLCRMWGRFSEDIDTHEVRYISSQARSEVDQPRHPRSPFSPTQQLSSVNPSYGKVCSMDSVHTISQQYIYPILTRLGPHVLIVTSRRRRPRRAPLDRQARAHRPLGRRRRFPPVAAVHPSNGGPGRRRRQARRAALCRGGDGRHRTQSNLRLGPAWRRLQNGRPRRRPTQRKTIRRHMPAPGSEWLGRSSGVRSAARPRSRAAPGRPG